MNICGISAYERIRGSSTKLPDIELVRTTETGTLQELGTVLLLHRLSPFIPHSIIRPLFVFQINLPREPSIILVKTTVALTEEVN
jgi:hypothetical protein